MKSLTTTEFIEVLLNKNVTRKDNFAILNKLLSYKNHEGSATQLAKDLAISDKAGVIAKITGHGKRILKHFQIKDKDVAYYEMFFNGHREGSYYLWSLKPALKKALMSVNSKIAVKTTSKNAFLLSWNPAKWEWTNLEDEISQVAKTGKVIANWKCVTKKPKAGDSVYLVVLGQEPRGIFGSGKVISTYMDKFDFTGERKATHYAKIEINVLVDPHENSLNIKNFKGKLKLQNWTPQSSGISIKPEVSPLLEVEWQNHLSKLGRTVNESTIVNQEEFTEGSAFQVIQTKYERDPKARMACLEIHGYSCKACKFNFEKAYGSIGKNFIHVHHLVPLASIGEKYSIDPAVDLIPVCANCHAMLHKSKPPLPLELLQSIIAKSKHIQE